MSSLLCDMNNCDKKNLFAKVCKQRVKKNVNAVIGEAVIIRLMNVFIKLNNQLGQLKPMVRNGMQP